MTGKVSCMADNIKTNVMRILEQHSIDYKEHHYFGDDAHNGEEVAEKMNVNPAHQFKTLVTVGKTKEHYVFLVPVNKELDLKKAAKAVEEKSIQMIKEKELRPLTGYIHGGCSPIAMKKEFKISIDETANNFDTIIFSAGKVGVSVEVSPSDLAGLIDFQTADISKN